jgi:hypothetical protein
MDRAPRFDNEERFDPRRIRLADIDGTGTADLLYIGEDGVHARFNQSGNAWSAANPIAVFPTADRLSTVQAIDLLGTGTACLVWSSPLSAETAAPLLYVEHGYTMRDTHAAAQFVAGREAIQPIIAEVSTCTAKVLATPDAAVVLAHGPVDPRELSPAQLADPSLATGQEIAAIGVLRPALRQCQQIALTKLATAVPVAVPPLAEFYAAATANSAQVQARAITWGEYNIRRRDLFLGLQRKLAAVQ